jgi:hypothetical protein
MALWVRIGEERGHGDHERECDGDKRGKLVKHVTVIIARLRRFMQ